MGSGKTHWGKIWAAAHLLDFIDLDEAIEKSIGKTVAEIFDEHGEDYFRLLETRMLHRFAAKKNTIISCGGGTPCYHGNLQWMNEHGTTIFINANSQDILQRVLKEQDKRPLLKKMNQAELLFFIEQKLKEREPFYTQANFIVDESTVTEKTFAELLPNNIND